jgi:ubiquinol-cytochrome c reductase cytochrome b subunit
VRSCKYRPVYRWFFWLLVISCIALGYLGAKSPEGGYLIAGRIFTAYYFIHFLVIMPLMGLIETPRPEPQCIADTLKLRGGGGQAPQAAPAAAE